MVYTTAVTLPILALGLWFGVNRLPIPLLDRVERLSSGSTALCLILLLVGLAAFGLLRFLLLALFAPRFASARGHDLPPPTPRPADKAGRA